MKDEIAAAVVFLSKILHKKDLLTKDQIEKFKEHLTGILVTRFKDHWHEEKPTRGQAYRCLRVNDHEPRDPVLEAAALKTGLRYEDLCFPSELTLWVDPREVCCRLGENRHSSYCRIASFREGSSENCAEALDLDKMLEEHESARKSEYNKFVQATSHRSRSPSNGGPCYTSNGGGGGSWSGGSGSPYQSGLYGSEGGMAPAAGGGGYYETVYYPPVTTAPNGYNNSSWNHKWNACTTAGGAVTAPSGGTNNNGSSRRSPPVGATNTPRDSPTTAINFQNNNKKNEKNGNGKGRARSAGHSHHGNVLTASAQKADRFHWVRHNNNAEVAKA